MNELFFWRGGGTFSWEVPQKFTLASVLFVLVAKKQNLKAEERKIRKSQKLSYFFCTLSDQKTSMMNPFPNILHSSRFVLRHYTSFN